MEGKAGDSSKFRIESKNNRHNNKSRNKVKSILIERKHKEKEEEEEEVEYNLNQYLFNRVNEPIVMQYDRLRCDAHQVSKRAMHIIRNDNQGGHGAKACVQQGHIVHPRSRLYRINERQKRQ
jgi:hypothetical protein